MDFDFFIYKNITDSRCEVTLKHCFKVQPHIKDGSKTGTHLVQYIYSTLHCTYINGYNTPATVLCSVTCCTTIKTLQAQHGKSNNDQTDIFPPW